jgi:hypothetical protein
MLLAFYIFESQSLLERKRENLVFEDPSSEMRRELRGEEFRIAAAQKYLVSRIMQRENELFEIRDILDFIEHEKWFLVRIDFFKISQKPLRIDGFIGIDGKIYKNKLFQLYDLFFYKLFYEIDHQKSLPDTTGSYETYYLIEFQQVIIKNIVSF